MLDEFPEFDRKVIDVLREPLEDRVVSVSRARGSAHFPAHFILVAALNPCPCGNFGTEKQCVCTPVNRARYARRLSGPIIDRVDLWLEVPKISYAALTPGKRAGGESAKARERVRAARERQRERFARAAAEQASPRRRRTVSLNSDMSVKEIDTLIALSPPVEAVLNAAATRMAVSPRVYHRVIKIARTIADLAGAEEIKADHMLEALGYRPKEASEKSFSALTV